ncbi:MAG: GNAT family N-acetyltransferase [Saprospiraceae bacterium]|nr:GNAT family N-acetyltransferase [Saprospiraceae bacterium]
MSSRLALIPADIPILEAALAGNDVLQDYLKVNIPDVWSIFGPEALQYSLDKLRESISEAGWWSYLPILIVDNTLVGFCGFKGSPNQEGMVEIGYEIAESYRQQGLATELAETLILHAFSTPGIKMVQAHTLGAENASTKVLSKCGMKKMEEINDPEDGIIWRWEILKVPDTKH